MSEPKTELTNSEIDVLLAWFDTSVLQLNQTNTYVISFNSSNQSFSEYQFSNSSIVYVLPKIREVFQDFVTIYCMICAVVALIGVISNINLLIRIKARHLQLQPLFAYIINMAAANLILAGLIFPATIANLMLRAWYLGELGCYVFPLLQTLPVNVLTLTFVAAAEHYYRIAVRPVGETPTKGKHPSPSV